MAFAPDADGEARPAHDGRAAALMDGTTLVDGHVPLGGASYRSRHVDGQAEAAAREQLLADLRRQLDSAPVIEQAKGMLMACFGCDADTAFAALRRWSTTRNLKLRNLAAEIVEAGASPHEYPFGGLREHLRARDLA